MFETRCKLEEIGVFRRLGLVEHLSAMYWWEGGRLFPARYQWLGRYGFIDMARKKWICWVAPVYFDIEITSNMMTFHVNKFSCPTNVCVYCNALLGDFNQLQILEANTMLVTVTCVYRHSYAGLKTGRRWPIEGPTKYCVYLPLGARGAFAVTCVGNKQRGKNTSWLRINKQTDPPRPSLSIERLEASSSTTEGI